MIITESIQILTIVLSVLTAAFFSAAETVLFLPEKEGIKLQLRNNPLLLRYFEKLVSEPKRLMICTSLAKITANVLTTVTAAAVLFNVVNYFGFNFWIAFVVVVISLAAILLALSEMIPRLLSVRNPVPAVKVVIVPLYWTSVFFYPITETISEIIKPLTSKTPGISYFSRKENNAKDDTISAGRLHGVLNDDENDLIRSVVESKTTIVREIMAHRTEITAVPHDISLPELIQIVQNSSHSRIPVYRENLDDILGVMYAKDLLRFLQKSGEMSDFSIHKITRTPLIVPETKLINELMEEFQEKKMHVAIVVDEYGGTSGLVTLENIIEEIVGELRDELSDAELPVKRVSETTFIVDAAISVDEFNEEFDIQLNDEERSYDTVAGWIFNQIGEIPKNGYTFHHGNYKIIITDAANNRIRRILVEKKS